MPVLIATYNLDLAKLPSRDAKLRIRFDRQVVNGKNRLLFLYPSSDTGLEPSYFRYGAGMNLKLGGPVTAQGRGQLVITSERILGVFTEGTFSNNTVSNRTLNEASGSVFAFALDLDDIVTTQPKLNRRGKPIEVVFASSEESNPWFVLHVIAVAASISNNGTAAPSSVDSFLTRLSPEGRRALRPAVSAAPTPPPLQPQAVAQAPTSPGGPNPFVTAAPSTRTSSSGNSPSPNLFITETASPIEPISTTMRVVEAIAHKDKARLSAVGDDFKRLSAQDIIGSLGELGKIFQQATNVAQTHELIQQELQAVEAPHLIKQGVEALGYTVLVAVDPERTVEVMNRLVALPDPPDALRAVVMKLVLATGRVVAKTDTSFHWSPEGGRERIRRAETAGQGAPELLVAAPVVTPRSSSSTKPNPFITVEAPLATPPNAPSPRLADTPGAPMSVTMRMVEAMARSDDDAALAAAEAFERLPPWEIVDSLISFAEAFQVAENLRAIQDAVMEQLRAVKRQEEVIRQGVEALGYTVLVVPDRARAKDVMARLAKVTAPPQPLRTVVEELVLVIARVARRWDIGVDLGDPPSVNGGEIALLIEFIRMDEVQGAADIVDKVSRSNDAAMAVIEGLLVWAKSIKGNVPYKDLEPIVMRYLRHQPQPRSEQAQIAIEEVGRAIFLKGDQNLVTSIINRQGTDPSLTDDERTDNMLSLVFVAGWMAKKTRTVLRRG